ncbi:MAG: 3-hydroxybutyryl-CoA dehydrogenase [Thermaceae bacterium]|nr:3-hydroxybutyryl-CoA dehydrogenase [Thermaceae bacterium]
MSERIAVLGAGTMGRGIAQVAAQAGYGVLLYDSQPGVLEPALAEIRTDLQKAQERGKLQSSADEILSQIQTVSALMECAEADWVIEAVPEVLELKQELLGKLAELNESNVLATNTSTISVSAIASKVKNPGRVIGLHFFNPAQRMKLVEVIPALQTASKIVERALRMMQAWSKEAVQVGDSPGFLVNRVARPFYGESLRLHGEGVSKEHLDWILKGLGFPMGPFELMDLIGLDVNFAASQSVYQGFYGEPRYRPHPLQYQRVAAGMLGRKTKQGWYRYPPGPPAMPALPPKSANLPLPFIIGPNAIAKELRAKFGHTDKAAEAAFVLDCRVKLERKTRQLGSKTSGQDSSRLAPDGLERKHDFFENLPVVSLVWGHSASSALAEFGGREIAGFSLVPPISEKSVVELYAPLSGPNRATELARAYFQAHGNLTLELPDQPGGVGFRVLALLINEAVSAVAEEVSNPANLDKAMRLGTGYPRGPLEWAEIIWLKPVLRALEGLHQELGEDRYRPHPLLQRMVAAGLESFDQLSLFPPPGGKTEMEEHT